MRRPVQTDLEFHGILPHNATFKIRAKFRLPFVADRNMSIEVAERLKSELTDKYVVVDGSVAELRRFQGKTGRIKTVNMNCRALVEFDYKEDISWYDIAPEYLTVVDAPTDDQPAAKSGKPAAKPATDKAASGAKKLSPLELAKQKAAGGEKKLSPLELAKQADGKSTEPASAGLSGLSTADLLAKARSFGN